VFGTSVAIFASRGSKNAGTSQNLSPKTGDCQNLTTSGAPSSSACSARRSGLFHRFPMTPTLPFSYVMASPGLAEYVTSIRESPVFLTYWAVIG
jgi:hypothetical protein